MTRTAHRTNLTLAALGFALGAALTLAGVAGVVGLTADGPPATSLSKANIKILAAGCEPGQAVWLSKADRKIAGVGCSIP